MRESRFHSEYDLAKIVAKCLYTGMAINVIIPVSLLFICYYISNNYYVSNQLGDMTKPVFYIFGILALSQAGLAIWWRGLRVNRLLVRGPDTFESDLTTNLARALKPVFFLIGSISIYGYLYFALTGMFTETVFFVILSFVVFQIIRPRYGFLEKVIARQQELTSKRFFYND